MIATLTNELHDLTLTDVIIIAGILAYILDRFVDVRGWSRSSKTLRIENGDLIRRNDELEDEIKRLVEKLSVLESKVSHLEQSDQKAVLDALKDHEIGAMQRHSENQALLERAVNALEGGNQ